MPSSIFRRTLKRTVLLAIASAPCVTHAQTPAPPELRFDAASVRPNLTAACRGRWDFTASHDTVTAKNAPLLRIISRAYNLTDDQVSGPAWIESQCYDITAKALRNTPDRDLMPMLQALLVERFHLASHREPEEKPIFALVVDKGGSKLHPYGYKTFEPSVTDGKTLFMARRMRDLSERLGKVTGRPVIDKTGLDGDYLIVLTYLPFSSADGDAADPASDIFSAVRDQLGLRLESQRGMVDVLKIDSVDKTPIAN